MKRLLIALILLAPSQAQAADHPPVSRVRAAVIRHGITDRKLFAPVKIKLAVSPCRVLADTVQCRQRITFSNDPGTICSYVYVGRYQHHRIHIHGTGTCAFGADWQVI